MHSLLNFRCNSFLLILHLQVTYRPEEGREGVDESERGGGREEGKEGRRDGERVEEGIERWREEKTERKQKIEEIERRELCYCDIVPEIINYIFSFPKVDFI